MTNKNIFIEDVAYGIYDRPGPTGKVAEEEEITVPEEVPLSPSQHMSNQLSVQRPPIEDEDYVPSSIEELSRAASAIAQLTPNESIEFFYRQLHKLLDDATDKASNPNDDTAEEAGKVAEEKTIRATINKILKEAGPIYTDDDLADYEEFRSGGYGVTEPDYEENSNPQEMGLDDLAKEFGYKGAPGVRQELERLTNRLTYFSGKVKKDDLDALVQYASGEYIDTLEEADLGLDAEDIDDLRKAPKLVQELDSFRFFFVSAFVMPSYSRVVKAATKNVKKAIAQLGVPKEIQQTVFNQVTGAASKKPQLIKSKLAKLVDKGTMTQDEAQEIASKVERERGKLIAAAEANQSDDFMKGAISKWSSLGKNERIKLVRTAMKETLENQ